MENQTFKYLFSPLETGKLRLKNRIVMLATTLHYSVEGGEMNERAINFWAERARGGAGLIITGLLAIDEYAGGHGIFQIDNDRLIPKLRELATAVHAGGAKIAAQLGHQGRYVISEQIGGKQPLSASAYAPAHFGRGVPKEMTLEDIKATIEHFAQGACRAREAGFDAVELLGSQGYLINQFLSPAANKRTDDYGGSLEKRLRFPLEVIKAVRQAVGPDFPVIMRMCAAELVPDGLGIEDTKQVAKVYEQAGIDILDMQVAWHESTVPSVYMAVPRGTFTYLAQSIKQSVSIPVIAVNRINDPWLAEEILRDGKADLIGMSRALIADPDLPNKAKENRVGDIRPCVGCLEGCLSFLGGSRQPVKCLTNPRAGREGELVTRPAAKRKKIVVVGGGPGGLEAAMLLSQRGHQVMLYEKQDKLGGEFRLAGLIPDKSEFLNYIAYCERQLTGLGVKVRLGKEATVEGILKDKPDAVVVATGGSPIPLPIPGIESPIVSGYREVIDGKELGQRVVIIGAGGVGCDIAILAARRGAPSAETLLYLLRYGAIKGEDVLKLDRGTRKVTLVEMQSKIGLGIYPQVRWVVLQELRRLGVESLTDTKCQRISADGIVVTRDGQERFIGADSIVVATGIRPENSLYQALKGKVPEVYVVGNASQACDALAAIEEAANLACKI